MNIIITIDRVILEGLTVEFHHRGLVKAALEAELTTLCATRGLPPGLSSGGAWPSLSGGVIHLTEAGTPGDLGKGIAQALYKGMGS